MVGPTPAELESLKDFLQWGPNNSSLFVTPTAPSLSPDLFITSPSLGSVVPIIDEVVEEEILQNFIKSSTNVVAPPVSPETSEGTDVVSSIEGAGEFDEFWDQTLHDLDALLNTFIVPVNSC